MGNIPKVTVALAPADRPSCHLDAWAALCPPAVGDLVQPRVGGWWRVLGRTWSLEGTIVTLIIEKVEDQP